MTRPRGIIVAAAVAVACAACGPAGDPDPSATVEARPPGPMAANYLQGAMRMARNGNLEGALEAIDRARRLSPSSPDVYLVHGQVLMGARDFDGARQALERAVALRPSDGRAREMLGHAAFQSRQYRDALRHYRAAADRSETPFVWQGIGAAYQELYLPDSAANAYRRVLALDSTFAPAWAALAEIREDAGRYDEALSLAEHASRAAPRASAYHLMRGRLLVQLGRGSEAIPLLQNIVSRDSTHYGAHYLLGQAYQQTDRPVLAEETLERAAALRHRMRERRPL